MRITSISFQQTFPTGNFSNNKLGMEIDIEEGDEIKVQDAFVRAKEICEKAFAALNPQINWNGETKDLGWYAPRATLTEDDLKEKTIDPITAMKELINSKYQNKKTLESLKQKVSDLNNPEVTEIFNNRLKSFE